MDRQFCPIGPFTSFGRLPRSNTVLLTTASPRAGTERNSSDAYSRTRPALCPECRSSFTGRPRLTSPTVNFDARQRERNLERLASEPFDLLVIGGGITGVGTALWMYDATGGARIGKLHKRLSKREALELMPDLDGRKLAAGFLYYDARVDDARLTLTVVKTAASLGAVAANRVEATGLLRSSGRVEGAVLTDRLT